MARSEGAAALARPGVTVMHEKTISELATDLRSGAYSSVELTRHFLDRIERLDPALNSFVTVAPERAIADAERADRDIAGGQAGPLTGVPIAGQ